MSLNNQRVIPETPQGSNAPSVLIADDQPAFLQMLRQVLAGVAGKIIECADGASAVLAYESHRPDWTLLDWAMPGVDGLTATRSIRSRHPGARVLILTSHLTPMLAREAAAAGAHACFPKERLHEAIALLRSEPSETTA